MYRKEGNSVSSAQHAHVQSDLRATLSTDKSMRNTLCESGQCSSHISLCGCRATLSAYGILPGM